jgi:hypothetical protein
MARARVWASTCVLLAACGARSHGGGGGAAHGAAGGAATAITLYRNLAVIDQRVEVDVPEAATATAHVVLAAGSVLDEIEPLDRGELVIGAIHDANALATAPPPPADAAVDAPAHAFAEDGTALFDDPPPPLPSADDDAPSHAPRPITIDVSAPHAGHYAFTLRYRTHMLTWDAAYTLTTTPARTAVEARGALVIANAGGVAFPAARVAVLDDTYERHRGEQSDQLRAEISGPIGSLDSDYLPARAHDLGRIDVVDGEVRVELYAPGARRALRPTLVYDAIGTTHDNDADAVEKDEDFGLAPPPSTQVVESAEIVRDAAADAGLPSAPARLVERRPDGSLVVLAAGQMFDAHERAAKFDTIPLGIARDVVGHRTRRDFNLDEDRERLTEEFALDLANQRAQPVQVIVREHMYRAARWSLAYASGPVAQDSAQEISLRATIPARGKASLMYVVVYWWDEPK